MMECAKFTRRLNELWQMNETTGPGRRLRQKKMD